MDTEHEQRAGMDPLLLTGGGMRRKIKSRLKEVLSPVAILCKVCYTLLRKEERKRLRIAVKGEI